MSSIRQLFNRTLILATVVAVALGTMPGVLIGDASAAVQNPSETARVSLTFDDANASALSQAAPTLAQYGLSGTSYVPTGCVGMTTVPNTCPADNSTKYMTWAQIQTLRNTYGWEIGSHTVNHPLLVSTDPQDQPIALTAAQVDSELSQSKAALAAHGIDAKSFATPYGDYNPAVLAQIAKYYENHRGFADTGYNAYPYSDYLLRDQDVRVNVSVATVKSYIDQAIANKSWLVLTFHDIRTKPRTGPDSYDYKTSNLATIAAYIKSKQAAGLITPVNADQGLVKSDVNLLPDGSFNTLIGSNWTTDNPSAIVRDTASNGSYPDPTNSIKLTANTSAARLFSPKVTVDSNTTYIFKNFLYVKQITSGEVTFYIDEYDANGSWISGQYKRGEPSVWAESMNFSYKPTSGLVRSASLQVAVPANSGIVAYLDNAQMFPLNTVTPPVQTNLVANGTFDKGIASGWSTNSPTTITADSGNNGSPANPVNSVKLTATTVNRHLFSPLVPVSSVNSYSINSYLDLRQISSNEVGYYIDEYDANGSWISGQYKYGVHAVSKGNVGLNYVPSSATVTKAGLQIIVTGNSGIVAYFDDVQWYQN